MNFGIHQNPKILTFISFLTTVIIFTLDNQDKTNINAMKAATILTFLFIISPTLLPSMANPHTDQQLSQLISPSTIAPSMPLSPTLSPSTTNPTSNHSVQPTNMVPNHVPPTQSEPHSHDTSGPKQQGTWLIGAFAGLCVIVLYLLVYLFRPGKEKYLVRHSSKSDNPKSDIIQVIDQPEVLIARQIIEERRTGQKQPVHPALMKIAEACYKYNDWGCPVLVRSLKGKEPIPLPKSQQPNQRDEPRPNRRQQAGEGEGNEEKEEEKEEEDSSLPPV